MQETINSPQIEADYGDKLSLHVLTRAISKFREHHSGQFPSPISQTEAKEVVNQYIPMVLTEMGEGSESVKLEFDEVLYTRLARISGASLNPMAAFLGGVLGIITLITLVNNPSDFIITLMRSTHLHDPDNPSNPSNPDSPPILEEERHLTK